MTTLPPLSPVARNSPDWLNSTVEMTSAESGFEQNKHLQVTSMLQTRQFINSMDVTSHRQHSGSHTVKECIYIMKNLTYEHKIQWSIIIYGGSKKCMNFTGFKTMSDHIAFILDRTGTLFQQNLPQNRFSCLKIKIIHILFKIKKHLDTQYWLHCGVFLFRLQNFLTTSGHGINQFL